MRDLSALRMIFFGMISRGTNGLDLGAGDGRWMSLAAQKHVCVTAIDLRSAPDQLPIGSNWIQADLHKGLPTILGGQTFDFMMCFDVIQWLRREYVLREFLPSLAHHARPGCVLALRTFWQNPIPAFDRHVPSLYQAEELVRVLPAWNILHAEQIEGDGPGLDRSTTRHWYSTDILARFPT